MLREKRVSSTKKEEEKKQEIILPSTIDLFVTLKCNFNCPYCYLPKNISIKESVNKNLLRLLEAKGVKNIYILGGEPFLLGDKLVEIIKYCCHKKIKILGISTNGSIINKKTLNLINILRIPLQVSLDASNSRAYRVIRNSDKFKIILRNIKKMIEKECTVILSMVLTKFNYQEIPAFVNLAKLLKVKKISLGSFISVGKGEKVKNWILNDRQVEEVKNLIFKIDNKIEIIGLKDNNCPAIKDSAAILPNGDIYPCPLFFSFPEAKLGNIYNQHCFLNARTHQILHYSPSPRCSLGISSVNFKYCKAFIYSNLRNTL